MKTIEGVVAGHNFGKATAVKRGRRPEWPYVAVVDHGTHTEGLRGFAFATRDEAVAKAVATIEARREAFWNRLADPRCRTLREFYGLPRELPK